MNNFLLELYKTNCSNGDTQLDPDIDLESAETFINLDIEADMVKRRNIDTSQFIQDKTSIAQMKYRKNPNKRLKLRDGVSHSRDAEFRHNTTAASAMFSSGVAQDALENDVYRTDMYDPRNPMVDTG